MLQMRARGFCARDGVPDALHGLYTREEIEEERRFRDAQDKVAVMGAEDLLPAPAPEEDLETPAAPAAPQGSSAPEVQGETIRDPDDFLSDLTHEGLPVLARGAPRGKAARLRIEPAMWFL